MYLKRSPRDQLYRQDYSTVNKNIEMANSFSLWQIVAFDEQKWDKEVVRNIFAQKPIFMTEHDQPEKSSNNKRKPYPPNFHLILKPYLPLARNTSIIPIPYKFTYFFPQIPLIFPFTPSGF